MEKTASVAMTLFFDEPVGLPKGQNVFPDTPSINMPYVKGVTVHSSMNEC